MASSVSQGLEEVKQQIFHGNFRIALESIDKISKIKNINKEDELANKILKSEVQNKLGNFEIGLQLADEVLKENQNLNSDLIQLDALIQKAHASYFLGELQKTFSLTEEALVILSKIENFTKTEQAERKSLLLTMQCIITGNLGDLSKCIELGEQSLAIAFDSGNKQLQAMISSNLSMFYIHINQIEKAEELVKQATSLANSIKNKQELSIAYFSHGTLKSHKREFQAAIDFFQKSEVLTNEIDSSYILHGIYNNLGVTFHNMWQLDEALEYYLKALNLREAARNLILNNIGEIYYHKNDLEKSEEYYLKALEISRKIKDYRVLPNTLYCLIRNNVERKDSEKIKEYLEELELLKKEIGYDQVDQYYRFAKVFVLKSSNNMSDWIEAAGILEEYLAQEKLPSDWRIDELFALAEIRLKELKLTGDKNAILEVRKQIERLQKEAESKQYYWLLINLYWLKSQLALIELDAQKAIQLLITAKTLAEEKNIGLLVEKINQEQKQLESQLTMWEKLREQNPPILEVLKQVPIEETAKHIVKDTVMEVRDEKTGDVIEYRKLFALKI